jgi:hypothetical protein
MRLVHCLASWQRATFALLVIFHVLAPIYVAWPRATNELLAALQDAVPFAEMALLALWLVLGPGMWPIRLPALFGMIYLVWRQGAYEAGDVEQLWSDDQGLSRLYYAATVESDYSVALLVLHAGVLLFALGAVRAFGFRLRSEPLGLNAKDQYSLRTLFLLITTAALALAGAEQLRACAPPELDVPKALALPAAAVAFAAAALISLRAALAPGSPLFRSLLAMGLCSGLGVGLAYVCRREEDCLLMAAWLAGFGAIVNGTLLGVRACGYHVAHRAEIIESVFVPPAGQVAPIHHMVPPVLVLLEQS